MIALDDGKSFLSKTGQEGYENVQVVDKTPNYKVVPMSQVVTTFFEIVDRPSLSSPDSNSNVVNHKPKIVIIIEETAQSKPEMEPGSPSSNSDQLDDYDIRPALSLPLPLELMALASPKADKTFINHDGIASSDVPTSFFDYECEQEALKRSNHRTPRPNGSPNGKLHNVPQHTVTGPWDLDTEARRRRTQSINTLQLSSGSSGPQSNLGQSLSHSIVRSSILALPHPIPSLSAQYSKKSTKNKRITLAPAFYSIFSASAGSKTKK